VDDFIVAMKTYEAGMKRTLGSRFYPPDIVQRREKMTEDAFVFLRATCWRWAAHAAALCPELIALPAVPSIGDAHAGNYALWRDAQARLVWGLSDFDEAARLPFALDLVRLCTSVKLMYRRAKARAICDAALAGYRAGLAAPAPFVLERDNLWLRGAFAASAAKRADFWAELDSAPVARPDAEFAALLTAALPDPGLNVRFARRSAGAGSLGRARFVAHGAYRGGPVAVEVKAALPSCWPNGREAGLAQRIARGPARSPDPQLCYGANAVVRRLAPNSRKIDFAKIDEKLRFRVVTAMAHELAAVHGDTPAARSRLDTALGRLPDDWLLLATRRVVDWTQEEFAAYRRSYPKL